MALNFPSSDASPWTAPNGVVYTWNTDGYWEAKADPADLDGEYLKLDASNDPVTGTCEFSDGVSVTGGQVSVNGDDISNNNAQTGVNLIGSGIVTARRAANSNVWVGYKTGTTAGTSFIKGDGRVGLGGEPSINSTFHLTGSHEGDAGDGIGIRTDATLTTGTGSGNIVGIDSRVETTDTGVNLIQFQAAGTQSESVGKQSGFVADNTLISSLSNQATNVYGFESRLNTNNDRINTFNFYAAGNAPNYFKTKVLIGGVSNTEDPLNTNSSILHLGVTPNGTMSVSRGATDADATAISINRVGNTSGKLITFYQTGTEVDSIQLDGSGGITYGTSDYRVKENIVDLPSATAAIKSLRPVNFNFNWAPGTTRPGFIAHEVSDVLPAAVVGDKDATVAIGTLADYDGTVLETEVTEPSAEELEYTEEVETDGVATMVTRTRSWTATGSRPVYQGVDQTKLIPLLTKALQEALTEIDTLKTRLSDAGIA